MIDEQRSRLERAAEAFRERYNSPKFADDITEALATIKAQEEELVQLRQVAHGALGTMPSAEIIALARAWRAKYGSKP